MSVVQKTIYAGSREQSGLWDILRDICKRKNVDNTTAFKYLQDEYQYLLDRKDIYLIRSEKLYDTDSCYILEKSALLDLTPDDASFDEKGPFYYLSNIPEI